MTRNKSKIPRTGSIIKTLYVYTTILPLWCTDGRYFIVIRVQHFFGYKLRLFRVKSDIFITFRVHQVQLKKVPLNGN